MGVADRVRKRQHQRQMEQQGADSLNGSVGQSSLVLVEPPHITRLKGVMNALATFIRDNQDGSPMGKMGIIVSSFGNEIAEEMSDMDALKTRIYMAQVGEMIAWIGHGDNERLPESVRWFAEGIQPTRKDDNSSATDAPTEFAAETRRESDNSRALTER